LGVRQLTYAELRAPKWGSKARTNVDKWGLQDVPTLLLAIQEELGEVGEELNPTWTADTSVENGLNRNTIHAVSSAWAQYLETSREVQQLHEFAYEDEDGNPRSDAERPYALTFPDEADMEQLQDEVDDLAALVFQLQAAVYAMGDE
jgi:NTP pyrophosphatase (non-canonical NTP hydrolase)